MDNQDISFNMTHGCFTYRVAALIINNNRLLLAKSEDYPHYYTIGGKVRLNETSEEAVIREAFEETGIDFEIDKLVFVQERFLKLIVRNIMKWFSST